MQRYLLKTLGALFLLAAPAVGQQRNTDIDKIGKRDINRGRPVVSDLASEMIMGREWANEIERRGAKLLDDPVVTEYVNRIGQNIAMNSDAKTRFTTKVVDSTAVNALALPGDFLYINAGLILAADNESQLAGIMAHLMAHVAARHASELEARGGVGSLSGHPPSILASPRSARTIPPQFYSFMLQSEEEADLLGVQYLYKAGYDPSAMVSMFQKLAANDIAGKVSESFDTHLQKEQRVTKVNEDIKLYLPPRQQNIVTTTEFQTVKARVIALTQ